jgi:preprotein translocase subunit SecE
MPKFHFLDDSCDYLPWQEHTQIFDYVAKQHAFLPLTNPRASRNLFHRRIDLLINKVTWPKKHPSKSSLFQSLENEIFVSANLCYFFAMSSGLDTSEKDFRKKLFHKPLMRFFNLLSDWC